MNKEYADQIMDALENNRIIYKPLYMSDEWFDSLNWMKFMNENAKEAIRAFYAERIKRTKEDVTDSESNIEAHKEHIRSINRSIAECERMLHGELALLQHLEEMSRQLED